MKKRIVFDSRDTHQPMPNARQPLSETRYPVSTAQYPTSFQQFERVCQKPDHRRIGNWMARRITRPMALRITWLLAPYGVHAHAVTLVGWACAAAAAVALSRGTVLCWSMAAGLLQLWYLLDHVDGQLARLRGTASLDGTQLDYLMHHTVHLLVPVGIGWGVTERWGDTAWIALGLAAGIGWLLVTLRHDARYKAFFRRLKRLDGELLVAGGGGQRPAAPPPMPRHPLKLTVWFSRKVGEMHVAMNLVALLAVVGWGLPAVMSSLAAGYLVVLAVGGTAVAAWDIAREQHAGTAEREFDAWFRPVQNATGGSPVRTSAPEPLPIANTPMSCNTVPTGRFPSAWFQHSALEHGSAAEPVGLNPKATS